MRIGNIWTFHDGVNSKIIARNSYWDGNNFVRIQQDVASQITFDQSGSISLHTAPSGATNSPITNWNTVVMANNGNVSIGTGSGDCKLTVFDNGSDITFIPSNEGNIGSNKGQIDFWHKSKKWNKVKAKVFLVSSDSLFKTDIQPIKNATAILSQIKTYSYFLKSDSIDIDTSGSGDSIEIKKRDYGVLAQEIAEILPSLVDSSKGNLFVNYNAFIGILIAGFNEQQVQIDTLQDFSYTLLKTMNNQQALIADLKTMVYKQETEIVFLEEQIGFFQKQVEKCCQEDGKLLAPPQQTPPIDESTHQGESQNNNPVKSTPVNENNAPEVEKAKLFQNVPNPFSMNTEIRFEIPEKSTSAKLLIHDMQGAEIKSYTITSKGAGNVVIQAQELQAGMYMYTLLVNNTIIDTKKMILTK
jgi:hypothetical protein